MVVNLPTPLQPQRLQQFTKCVIKQAYNGLLGDIVGGGSIRAVAVRFFDDSTIEEIISLSGCTSFAIRCSLQASHSGIIGSQLRLQYFS